MTRGRFSRRCIPNSLVLLIAVGVLLVGAATAQAAGVPSLAAAYSSNGVSASIRGVQPTVSGLFQVNAPRAWVDALDVSGNPGQNGIPDFLDTWEAFRTRTSSAILKNGYAFTRIDEQSHEILYTGVERASAGGPSSVTLEFNQKPGERTIGDLKIIAEIDAAGNVGTVRFESYSGEGAKGSAKFLLLSILSGEGCNDAGTACVVANGALLEVGYNLTVLGKPEKDFAGIQITTPEDHVVGTFGLSPSPLPSAPCPSNLHSCTANDVSTTVKTVVILNNDLCTSLTDTIDLEITNTYAATSSQRFDLGLFVSGDGGTVQEPSTATRCFGAAAQVGQGDSDAYPDADHDLFLSLDPTGHSATPTTADTCGDLSASAGPVDWTVDVTVDCNIVNGALRIPSCRVWEQNANHKTSCTNLQQAGTGSKCDCTDLVVTAQLNPCAAIVCNDGNACTLDHCRVIGTPPNATAECYTEPDTGATCDDGNACTTGTTCQSDGSCGGATSTDACDDGNVCTDDTCDTASGCVHTPNTLPCDDGNACNGREVCSGGTCTSGTPLVCNDGNVCTTDTCNPATGCVFTNNTGPCSDNNLCTGGDHCSGGSCVPGTTPVVIPDNYCSP